MYIVAGVGAEADAAENAPGSFNLLAKSEMIKKLQKQASVPEVTPQMQVPTLRLYEWVKRQ